MAATAETIVVTSNSNKRIITHPSPSIMKKFDQSDALYLSGIRYRGISEELNRRDDLSQVANPISTENEEAKRIGQVSRKKGHKHHQSALDRVGYKMESESLYGSNDVSSTGKVNSGKREKKGGATRSTKQSTSIRRLG